MSLIINSTPNTPDGLVGRSFTDQLPTILANYNMTMVDWDYLNTLATKQSNWTTNPPHHFDYCSQDFIDFRHWFIGIHGFLCAIVCLFGLVTNILNIIVLTRKDMLSPTNAILTGLAIADMMVMLDYLPFTVYSYILSDQLDVCIKYSYSLAWCTLFHAHFSVMCHNVSIGLTLTLAVWRFIAVSYPQRNREWCNMSQAILAIFICYIFIPVFSIPIILSFEIKLADLSSCDGAVNTPTVMTSSSAAIAMTASAIGGGAAAAAASPSSSSGVVTVSDGEGYASTLCTANCTLYEIRWSDIAMDNNLLLQKLNFWVYSVLVKILPCIALTVLSLTLIRALYRTNRRRSQLKNRNCCNADRSCDRTTRMLLAILLLFLITEFPQGIMALLSGILGETFYERCVTNFNEIVDLLALINSAINFILYCVMSKQFRQTFRHLFTPTIINNWIAIQHEVTTTQATTCV